MEDSSAALTFATHPHFLGALSASRRAAALLLVGLAPLLSACSDDTGDDGDGTDDPDNGSESATPFCEPVDSCPVDASDEDLTTPVSFRDDVFPVLQANCNDSTCHGGDNPTFLPALGPASGDLDDATASSIVSQLLTTTPETTADLAYVAAGDWENSFLMLKVDGCQNEAGLTCETTYGTCGGDCGDGMPLDENLYPLSAGDRTTIRAWIAQGAGDN